MGYHRPPMRPHWRRFLIWASAGLAALALAAAAVRFLAPEAWGALMRRVRGEQTVAGAAGEIAPEVGPGLAELFAGKGCKYPPERLTFIALKDERRLEVWAPLADGRARLVREYPVLAASGRAGPKLREGDRQVPEGVYGIVALNPNSRFHLSMMLDYPNSDDVAAAERAGRSDLGGEIFIHGGAVSIGCLAVGDRAIENLFVLVADVGMENVRVIIAPRDPRDGSALQPIPGLASTGPLYRRVEESLRPFVVPAGGSAGKGG